MSDHNPPLSEAEHLAREKEAVFQMLRSMLVCELGMAMPRPHRDRGLEPAVSAAAKDCDCRADLEAKLLQRFEAQQPDLSGHKVSLQGYGFVVLENSMRMRPYMEYAATADHPVKKTGGTKPKTTRGTLTFSFCPFCGTKFPTAADIANAQKAVAHG